MKSPDEIAALVGKSLAKNNRVTAEDLDLVEAGLVEHPESVELWCLRGDVIQLSDGDKGYALEDAKSSYMAARDLDPDNPEPWESLGSYYHAICSEPEKAEPNFLKAIELGAGEDAREALEEVRAELDS